MGPDRSNLGFGDELEEFDPKAWTRPESKIANDRPGTAATKAAAKEAGFQSRPAAGQETRRQRRRRTGRNAQFNIKTTQEAIAAFTAIADQLQWGLGETFEKAIPLLEQEYLGTSQK